MRKHAPSLLPIFGSGCVSMDWSIVDSPPVFSFYVFFMQTLEPDFHDLKSHPGLEEPGFAGTSKENSMQ